MSRRTRFAVTDLNYLAILQNPIIWGVQQWAAKPENKAWLPDMPSWLLPFSLGLAVATLAFDIAFRRDSRIRQVWGWLFDYFEIKGVDVGHFGAYGGNPMTPQSDVAVRIRVRFLKDRHFKCWLRVHELTGMGREPFERILPIAEQSFVRGEELWVPIVDMGIAQPGWDHTIKRGWGPMRDHTLIGGACNVVVFECKGRFRTQKHKIFIGMVNHDSNPKNTPSLYVQSEGDDIWDVSSNSELARYRNG